MTRFKPYFAQDLFPICSLDRSDTYCLGSSRRRATSQRTVHTQRRV
ncbi:hypothetical protein BIFCAT_00674 [Bifidobacterium catenulatum DSM 16992 = JCM 1194 = LMG 11043]|uniref:Uncharacterized protein n=1 Tax=Bifidobacterium catenulatum DSM 16992 = JCM 1194 = LMG 11043 TaxID=566552 RepID=B6XUW1_9BIFI|nr:hypothetical protein BIFCAT_00674 [Bifidobacterium catenulatum DSM 16992 = JCM 1194 = LMG 11043]